MYSYYKGYPTVSRDQQISIQRLWNSGMIRMVLASIFSPRSPIAWPIPVLHIREYHENVL